MAVHIPVRCIYLISFTLLYILDVAFDVYAVVHWHSLDGSYSAWFIIGVLVVALSFVMQWIYCLQNMNEHFRYLHTYRYTGWHNYEYYLNFNVKHYPAPINVPNNNSSELNLTRPLEVEHKSISESKERCRMICKFLFQSIVCHLFLQSGIVEAVMENIRVLQQFNKHSSSTKRHIFKFDPKNGCHAATKYANPVLQFNSNYITSHFADLCLLHCYFESVIMALLHCTYFLSQCASPFPNSTTSDLLLSVFAFITSMLCLMIFALNFEKSKVYPSYFEYDTLQRIKYIFPDLYLYPSTYSIYKIYISSASSSSSTLHHHHHHHNHHHHDHNGHSKGHHVHRETAIHRVDDPLPPPTCHYPTTLSTTAAANDTVSDRQNNRVETMSNHIPSDIFSDQNDHHDDNRLSVRKRVLLFLCRFTFYLYIFADFWCRCTPFIVLWITRCHSPSNDNTYPLWLFWVNMSLLIAFSLFVVVHFVWLHKKYSEYFKPSACYFWSYTIKRYLHCHFIHPLRSILDVEPLLAFILRNVLFWFGTLIICNISVFGFIFQRPTLFNYARRADASWPRMRRKVERNIRCESLFRYFGGFVLILLTVISDHDSDNDSDSEYGNGLKLNSYFWGIWTFIYCVFALYGFFMVNKLAPSSLFRIDAMWIMRVRKKGWLMSRTDEGLIWHRNYNKAQSFRIKRRDKQRRKRQRRKHRAKSRGKSRSDARGHRDRGRGEEDEYSDSEMNRYRAHDVEMRGIDQMADKLSENAAQKIAERQARGRTDVAQHHVIQSQQQQQRQLSGKEIVTIPMVPVEVMESEQSETALTMPDHIATDSTSHENVNNASCNGTDYSKKCTPHRQHQHHHQHHDQHHLHRVDSNGINVAVSGVGTEVDVSVSVKSTIPIQYDSKMTATPSCYEAIAGFTPSKQDRPPPFIRRTTTNTPSMVNNESVRSEATLITHTSSTKPYLNHSQNSANINIRNKTNSNHSSHHIMRLSASEPPPSLAAQREMQNVGQFTVDCNVNNITKVDHSTLSALSTNTNTNTNTTTTTTKAIAGSTTNRTTVSMSLPPKYPPPQLAVYHLFPKGNASKVNVQNAANAISSQPVVPRSQSLSFNERHHIKEITDQNQNRSSFSNSGSERRRIMLMEDDDQSDESSDDDIAIVHPEIEGHQSLEHHYGSTVAVPSFNDRDVRRSVSMHDVLLDHHHQHGHHQEPGSNPKKSGLHIPRSQSDRNLRENLSVDFNLCRAHKADSLPIQGVGWRPRNIIISDINRVIEHSPDHHQQHPHHPRSMSKAESTSPIKIKWPHGHGHDHYGYPHVVIPPGLDPTLKRLSWSMDHDMKVPLKWLMHRRSVSRSRSKREETQDRKRKKKRVKSIQRNLAKERGMNSDSRLYKRLSVDSTRSTHSVHSAQSSNGNEVSSEWNPLKRGMKRKGDNSTTINSRFPSKSVAFHQTHSFSSFSEPSDPNLSSPRKRARRGVMKRGKEKRFGLSSGMTEEMGSIDERGALMHDSPSSSDTEEFEPGDDPMSRDVDHYHHQGAPIKKVSVSSAVECSRSMSLNSSMSVFDGTDRAASVDSSLGSSIQNVEKQLFETLRKLSSQQLVKSASDHGHYKVLRMKDRQSMDDEEGGSEGSHFHIDREGK